MCYPMDHGELPEAAQKGVEAITTEGETLVLPLGAGHRGMSFSLLRQVEPWGWVGAVKQEPD